MSKHSHEYLKTQASVIERFPTAESLRLHGVTNQQIKQSESREEPFVNKKFVYMCKQDLSNFTTMIRGLVLSEATAIQTSFEDFQALIFAHLPNV